MRAESQYRHALEQMKAMHPARVAGNPDEVGEVIASIVDRDDPPIRIAVGQDAEALIATGADPNTYVPMMATFVATTNRPQA